MGSEKYRGERTFDEFVSRHGGLCNASTDYERVSTNNSQQGQYIYTLFFFVVCLNFREEFLSYCLSFHCRLFSISR